MGVSYGTLPEELIELVFDKLLEQYSPDLETKTSLFSLGDRKALSSLSTVSLMVARRTRTHRFKCVVLLWGHKAAKFYHLLASFLELSFSSRYMGRLLPISTITTCIKIVTPYAEEWARPQANIPNDDRVLSFILRVRKELSLEELSWPFHPMFNPSVRFHQRFAGLLLSPGMKTLAIRNFTSNPSRLQGAYVPGPSFDRIVRFGEEEEADQLGNENRRLHAYPSYTKLELGGSKTTTLPLPFAIPLPNGTIYRPFARVRTFLALDGLPYSITESVLENNDGSLEVLHIEEAFDFLRRGTCMYQRSCWGLHRFLTPSTSDPHCPKLEAYLTDPVFPSPQDTRSEIGLLRMENHFNHLLREDSFFFTGQRHLLIGHHANRYSLSRNAGSRQDLPYVARPIPPSDSGAGLANFLPYRFLRFFGPSRYAKFLGSP